MTDHDQHATSTALDLESVREAVWRLEYRPFYPPSIWPAGIFVQAPHVKIVQCGLGVLLKGHEPGHPEWWQLALRPYDEPDDEWFDPHVDWVIVGNEDAMRVDLTLLILSDYHFKPGLGSPGHLKHADEAARRFPHMTAAERITYANEHEEGIRLSDPEDDCVDG